MQGIIPPLGRKFIEDFGLDTWPGAGGCIRALSLSACHDCTFRTRGSPRPLLPGGTVNPEP